MFIRVRGRLPRKSPPPRKIFRRDVRSASISTPMEVMGTWMASRRADVKLFLFQDIGAIHDAWSMKGSPGDATGARGQISSRACRTTNTPFTKLKLIASGSRSVRTPPCGWRRSTSSLCPTTSSRRSASQRSVEQRLQHKSLVTSSRVSTLSKGAGLWHVAPRTRKVSRSANRETFEECGSNQAFAEPGSES